MMTIDDLNNIMHTNPARIFDMPKSSYAGVIWMIRNNPLLRDFIGQVLSIPDMLYDRMGSHFRNTNYSITEGDNIVRNMSIFLHNQVAMGRPLVQPVVDAFQSIEKELLSAKMPSKIGGGDRTPPRTPPRTPDRDPYRTPPRNVRQRTECTPVRRIPPEVQERIDAMNEHIAFLESQTGNLMRSPRNPTEMAARQELEDALMRRQRFMDSIGDVVGDRYEIQGRMNGRGAFFSQPQGFDEPENAIPIIPPEELLADIHRRLRDLRNMPVDNVAEQAVVADMVRQLEAERRRLESIVRQQMEEYRIPKRGSGKGKKGTKMYSKNVLEEPYPFYNAGVSTISRADEHLPVTEPFFQRVQRGQRREERRLMQMEDKKGKGKKGKGGKQSKVAPDFNIVPDSNSYMQQRELEKTKKFQNKLDELRKQKEARERKIKEEKKRLEMEAKKIEMEKKKIENIKSGVNEWRENITMGKEDKKGKGGKQSKVAPSSNKQVKIAPESLRSVNIRFTPEQHPPSHRAAAYAGHRQIAMRTARRARELLDMGKEKELMGLEDRRF